MLVVDVKSRPDVFQVLRRVEQMLGISTPPAALVKKTLPPPPKSLAAKTVDGTAHVAAQRKRTQQQQQHNAYNSNRNASGEGGLFDLLDWQSNDSRQQQQQQQYPVSASPGAFVQPRRRAAPTQQPITTITTTTAATTTTATTTTTTAAEGGGTFDDDWADFSDFLSAPTQQPQQPQSPSGGHNPRHVMDMFMAAPTSTSALPPSPRITVSGTSTSSISSSGSVSSNTALTKRPLASPSSPRVQTQPGVASNRGGIHGAGGGGSGDLFDQLEWLDNANASTPAESDTSDGLLWETQFSEMSMQEQQQQTDYHAKSKVGRRRKNSLHAFTSSGGDGGSSGGGAAMMQNIRRKWNASFGSSSSSSSKSLHKRSLSAQVFPTVTPPSPTADGEYHYHSDSPHHQQQHQQQEEQEASFTPLDRLVSSRPSLSVKEVLDVGHLGAAMRTRSPERLWVLKATSSAKTEPKPKYVRKLIMAMWSWRSGSSNSNSNGRHTSQPQHAVDRVLLYMRSRPIFSSPIVCFKALTTVHHILQDGPTALLQHMAHNTSLLADIQDIWSAAGSGFGSSSSAATRDPHFPRLIGLYAGYLLERLSFHDAHPAFEANFSLERHMKQQQQQQQTVDIAAGDKPPPPLSLDTVYGLLSLLERINAVTLAVFQDKAHQCKVGCLVPLVYDAQDVYCVCTWLLSKLSAARRTGDSDLLEAAEQRYRAVYRQFFQQMLAVRNFRPVASVVAMPGSVLQGLKSQPPAIPNDTVQPPPSVEATMMAQAQAQAQVAASAAGHTMGSSPLRTRASASGSARHRQQQQQQQKHLNYGRYRSGRHQGEEAQEGEDVDEAYDSDLDETESVDVDDSPVYYHSSSSSSQQHYPVTEATTTTSTATSNSSSNASGGTRSNPASSLEDCLRMPGNERCADCSTPLGTVSKWASINLGIFICQQCAGFHRGLGVHISKVRSVSLDTWSREQVQFMATVGNAAANRYWEAGLAQQGQQREKPTGCSDLQRLGAFIRRKYADREWVPRRRAAAGSTMRGARGTTGPISPVPGSHTQDDPLFSFF